MQGLFLDTDDSVHYVLRIVVVLLGFWTAWRAGRAAADGWSGYSVVVVYTLLLACAMQFLHHALFNGPSISVSLYLLDFVTLLVFSTIGYRMRRTSQMVNNYYWLYERSSPVSWKNKN